MPEPDNHILLAKTELGTPGGLPVVVKDTIDIAGLPTRGASRALEDAPAALSHADVVERLLDGGCEIIGKSNMHELAYGMTGVNSWTGTPANALYPGRIPGGSSSGSAAAVAAGIARIAIGTDTGGSIRMPAACCGVFGLKPTFGLVSRRGAVPEQTTLDCIGPFAASIDDIELAMAMIAPGFAAMPVPLSVRLGTIVGPVSEDVASAFGEALGRLRAHQIETDPVELQGLAAAFDANMAIIAAETFSAFGHLLPTGRIGTDVAARLSKASEIDSAAMQSAETVRASFTSEVDNLLGRHDALLMPALCDGAPTLAEATDPAAVLRLSRLVRPFNLSGHPAIVIPYETSDGRPFGLQLVGRKHDDALLCAAARAVAGCVGVTKRGGPSPAPSHLPSSSHTDRP